MASKDFLHLEPNINISHKYSISFFNRIALSTRVLAVGVAVGLCVSKPILGEDR